MSERRVVGVPASVELVNADYAKRPRPATAVTAENLKFAKANSRIRRRSWPRAPARPVNMAPKGKGDKPGGKEAAKKPPAKKDAAGGKKGGKKKDEAPSVPATMPAGTSALFGDGASAAHLGQLPSLAHFPALFPFP